MPLVLADRVKETTTTAGTGTITLAGAATGFQSFSVIGNGNTTYYTISSQGSSEWEVGIGTYTSSGTTLSRDTVLASSAGAPNKTNFSAGTKDVFVTYTAARSVNVDGSTLDTFGMGATQGDILYADGTDNFVRLAKNTTATRYLANTGTSNNPAWAQVDLSNGVTGDLPFSNLAQGSALSVLGVTGNATADNASIAAGTDHQVLRRSGTALAFGSVNLAQSAAITGTLPVANGGTGQTTYTDGQLLIGNTTGNTLAKATLTAGTGITVTNGAGTITLASSVTGLTAGTATVGASGVEVGFTGLPSGIRLLWLTFNALSTNGTTAILCQIGSGGSYSTSGYTTGFSTIDGTNATTTGNNTSGFTLRNTVVAADSYTGCILLLNITGNTWVGSSILNRTSNVGASQTQNGFIALGGTLDRVRLYINGTQTFDAGNVNIFYI